MPCLCCAERFVCSLRRQKKSWPSLNCLLGSKPWFCCCLFPFQNSPWWTFGGDLCLLYLLWDRCACMCVLENNLPCFVSTIQIEAVMLEMSHLVWELYIRKNKVKQKQIHFLISAFRNCGNDQPLFYTALRIGLNLVRAGLSWFTGVFYVSCIVPP